MATLERKPKKSIHRVDIGSAYDEWMEERDNRYLTNEEFALLLLRSLNNSPEGKMKFEPSFKSASTILKEIIADPLPKTSIKTYSIKTYSKERKETPDTKDLESLRMESKPSPISEDMIVPTVNHRSDDDEEDDFCFNGTFTDETNDELPSFIVDRKTKLSGDVSTEKDVVMEDSLTLVSVMMLTELLKMCFGVCCTLCKQPLEYTMTPKGTVLAFSWNCTKNTETPHTKGNWESQHSVSGLSHGNMMFSRAMLLSKIDYDKIALLAKYANIYFFGKATFNRYQEVLLYPAAVKTFWNKTQLTEMKKMVMNRVSIKSQILRPTTFEKILTTSEEDEDVYNDDQMDTGSESEAESAHSASDSSVAVVPMKSLLLLLKRTHGIECAACNGNLSYEISPVGSDIEYSWICPNYTGPSHTRGTGDSRAKAT